ncbi:hypothetical protein IBT49_22130 [Erwinia sp. S63]|nr:hypothetical protein [Erwinia sp. S63]
MWCKDGGSGAQRLPDETSLYDKVMRYNARRGLYNSPVAYPWQENLHYWMISSLYSQMHTKSLSESKLRTKCHVELSKMSKRIKAGECILPPRPQIKKLYVPISTEKEMAHIGQLKILLKRSITSL